MKKKRTNRTLVEVFDDLIYIPKSGGVGTYTISEDNTLSDIQDDIRKIRFILTLIDISVDIRKMQKEMEKPI